MRRPKNQIPLALKRCLSFNHKSGYYEVIDKKITYLLDMGQMETIKTYFHDHSSQLVTAQDWYNDLSKEERKRVKRTGMKIEDNSYSDGDFLD